MTYSVCLSLQAELDLHGIFSFIAQASDDLQTASAWLDGMEARILGLEILPRRYRLYEEGTSRSRGLRRMPVGRYNVFYSIDEEEKRVTVVRILFAGMDAANRL